MSATSERENGRDFQLRQCQRHQDHRPSPGDADALDDGSPAGDVVRDRSCSHVALAEMAFDVGGQRRRSELSLDCHQPRVGIGGGVMEFCESWKREKERERRSKAHSSVLNGRDLELPLWVGWMRSSEHDGRCLGLSSHLR